MQLLKHRVFHDWVCDSNEEGLKQSQFRSEEGPVMLLIMQSFELRVNALHVEIALPIALVLCDPKTLDVSTGTSGLESMKSRTLQSETCWSLRRRFAMALN